MKGFLNLKATSKALKNHFITALLTGRHNKEKRGGMQHYMWKFDRFGHYKLSCLQRKFHLVFVCPCFTLNIQNPPFCDTSYYYPRLNLTPLTRSHFTLCKTHACNTICHSPDCRHLTLPPHALYPWRLLQPGLHQPVRLQSGLLLAVGLVDLAPVKRPMVVVNNLNSALSICSRQTYLQPKPEVKLRRDEVKNLINVSSLSGM